MDKADMECLYLADMDATKVEKVKAISIDNYIKLLLHKRKEQERIEKLKKKT